MKRYQSRNLRKGRTSIRNHVYLVTTVTVRRAPLFMDLVNARMVVNALRFSQQQEWAKTLAYVLMPDHLHWLLVLGDGKSLSQLVHSVKSFTATKISGKRDESVWQDGFHDHAVRFDENLRGLARYLIANPLRAGLVKRIGDYPWWDAMWLDDGGGFDWS